MSTSSADIRLHPQRLIDLVGVAVLARPGQRKVNHESAVVELACSPAPLLVAPDSMVALLRNSLAVDDESGLRPLHGIGNRLQEVLLDQFVLPRALPYEPFDAFMWTARPVMVLRLPGRSKPRKSWSACRQVWSNFSQIEPPLRVALFNLFRRTSEELSRIFRADNFQ